MDFVRLVEEVVIKQQRRIRRATQPLHDFMPVNYVTYHRIDSAGNYITIVDRPEWAEHYVANKLYLIDPFIRHPDCFRGGCAFLDAAVLRDERYSQCMGDMKFKFELDHGFILIEKGDGYVDFLGFTAPPVRRDIYDYYVAHRPLLKRFIPYLREELRAIVAQQDEEPVALPTIKGAAFVEGLAASQGALSPAVAAYLEAIGAGTPLRRWSSLSQRQRQCLALYGAGHAAPAIAALLALSTRTVEHYIVQLKNKLSCHSKEELIDAYCLFRELGLCGDEKPTSRKRA